MRIGNLYLVEFGAPEPEGIYFIGKANDSYYIMANSHEEAIKKAMQLNPGKSAVIGYDGSLDLNENNNNSIRAVKLISTKAII